MKKYCFLRYQILPKPAFFWYIIWSVLNKHYRIKVWKEHVNKIEAIMKVKFNRTALQDALALVTSVIPSRTPKPILQCLRITSEDDAVKI